MASLRRVAELNNSGASMLVAARDKDAFKTLQTALTIMEQEMMTAPDKSESSDSTASTTSTRRSSSSTDSSLDDADGAAASVSEAAASASLSSNTAARFCIDTKCSTAIPELRDDRYFIFNQALLVETRDNTAEQPPPSAESQQHEIATTDDSSPYPQSLVCFYTSVVIYNLALAYHKRGMSAASASNSSSSGSSLTGNTGLSNADYSRMALSQSQRLYEHSLKIIRSIANYSEDCKMLLYAVSCNLAHLYCRKGDRCRAQELLNGLEEANRLSYQNILN
ncbi:expressed unknown protein [Seminavis robusta]|uniref:Uncharacterized protein n=1 Tax=Seminavis robusta TaxID=568900 RepID=A0A9N8EUU3_9STRA|nr:expressed unknown protein [Seminavis robusta]|eukprot:Sro1888_g303650.1 n/a (280) ;mRNA; r:12074-12913